MLDYSIVEESVANPEKPERERINHLRVKLKNAAMRYLIKVKEPSRAFPSVKEILANEVKFLKKRTDFE